ncbi:hypothetical protein [Leptospira santarosai]|uniref:hypothetical protein n=1 Tax=Leptospira santarosai TaxID=28183 RepID=UPI0002C039DE|nr:hypothetical protein [Leptospira santarosai]EMJ48770.1 hypothetical protein LEP1GSC169_1008 [Leptospira santarosai str. HAI1349]EMO23211.1 hypothetical protein LEP1GSC168_1001 [Leptospira santarosai str. HAI134]EMP01947.1 hypothetical protein LEP1GSC171_0399 [Leptospira santarosai str. HAI1380]EMP81153.1 hypothetical protein LEP1GSC162_1672 [Leptospira santarosai str. CBC1531]
MRFVYGVRGSDFVGVPTYFVFTKKNSYVEPSYFGGVLKFFQTKRSALIKNPLKQSPSRDFKNSTTFQNENHLRYFLSAVLKVKRGIFSLK